MNKATRDIMKLLSCDPQTALDVQRRMGQNGLDFSECDQAEFDAAAYEVYQEVLA